MGGILNYNKLLFGGPVGAGKTTAIRALSHEAPISTEAPLAQAMGEKSTTTVALDYSFLRMDDAVIHLYGLPGQKRLSFMRDILVPGALGVVLLLDGTRPQIYEDAYSWLESLTALDVNLTFAIGITKTDQGGDVSLNELRKIAAHFSKAAPILSVDARDEDSIKQLLRILVALKGL